MVSRDHPVVISKYITGAKEVEMDAIGNEGELVNYAIAEHIENAGVHSGDATLLLPAQRLFVETHRRVKSISQKLCKALKISGVEGVRRSARSRFGKFPSSTLGPVLFVFIRLIRSLSQLNLRFLHRVGSDFLPAPSKCHVLSAGRAIQHPVHLQGQRSQGH